MQIHKMTTIFTQNNNLTILSEIIVILCFMFGIQLLLSQLEINSLIQQPKAREHVDRLSNVSNNVIIMTTCILSMGL